MVSANGLLFIVAQFGSRFANTFLTTLVRYELLEHGGVAKFASAQVANQVARVFMQQVAGVLAARYPLKRLYVVGEALNFLLVLAVLYASMFNAGVTTVLFFINIGLGLTQAFSAPIAKSMPPAVVEADDLAIVNSWDLTGDKIGRNLAPMVFTVVSSALGFKMAIAFSFASYSALVAMKQLLTVADKPASITRDGNAAKSALQRFLVVFEQVGRGMLALKSDWTIGLLIMNTIVTNMLVYPLGTIVFPVIFKSIPEGEVENEHSFISAFILGLQDLLGVHKKKAWMNYAALVGLGGVVGPFLSTYFVYRIKLMSSKRPQAANWIGINFGISGQILTLLPLLLVLHFISTLSAGMRIFSMFLIWGLMNSMNNITTIYFNAHSQQRLSREERGSFIANILTLFTMANSVGSLFYGWALASESAEHQVSASNRILFVALIARMLILMAIRADKTGKETVMLKKQE